MKCTVCGKRFKPKKENKYIVAKKTIGIAEMIVGGGEKLECFDCPRCGCQIVAGTRLEKIIELTEKSDETT